MNIAPKFILVKGVLDVERENRGEHVLKFRGGREKRGACAVP